MKETSSESHFHLSLLYLLNSGQKGPFIFLFCVLQEKEKDSNILKATYHLVRLWRRFHAMVIQKTFC